MPSIGGGGARTASSPVEPGLRPLSPQGLDREPLEVYWYSEMLGWLA